MMALPGPPAEARDRLAVARCSTFATRGPAESWWQAQGVPGRPWVVADDAVQPSVLVPLYATGRPLRQLGLVGPGPADELGPLRAPEHRAHPAAVLLDALDDPAAPPWDVVLLQDVPVDHGWDRLLGGTVVGGVVSPVVRLGDAGWRQLPGAHRRALAHRARARGRAGRAPAGASPLDRGRPRLTGASMTPTTAAAGASARARTDTTP